MSALIIFRRGATRAKILLKYHVEWGWQQYIVSLTSVVLSKEEQARTKPTMLPTKA
jgi:hypothetical protein